MSGSLVGVNTTVSTSGILKATVGLIATGFIFKFGRGGVLIFITGSIINGTPLSTTGIVETKP